jgi:hypothetical protein
MTLKYIIVTDDWGTEIPILFPELLDHSAVARSFDRVLSAGFVSIGTRWPDALLRPRAEHREDRGLYATCYGSSTTLRHSHPDNCASRIGDSEMIQKMLNEDL